MKVVCQFYCLMFQDIRWGMIVVVRLVLDRLIVRVRLWLWLYQRLSNWVQVMVSVFMLIRGRMVKVRYSDQIELCNWVVVRQVSDSRVSDIMVMCFMLKCRLNQLISCREIIVLLNRKVIVICCLFLFQLNVCFSGMIRVLKLQSSDVLMLMVILMMDSSSIFQFCWNLLKLIVVLFLEEGMVWCFY